MYPEEWNSEFKAAVRERDGCHCAVCGVSENGVAHDVHHINYIKTDEMIYFDLCLKLEKDLNKINLKIDYLDSYDRDIIFSIKGLNNE